MGYRAGRAVEGLAENRCRGGAALCLRYYSAKSNWFCKRGTISQRARSTESISDVPALKLVTDQVASTRSSASATTVTCDAPSQLGSLLISSRMRVASSLRDLTGFATLVSPQNNAGCHRDCYRTTQNCHGYRGTARDRRCPEPAMNWAYQVVWHTSGTAATALQTAALPIELARPGATATSVGACPQAPFNSSSG
jgi:hypothetical protein